MESKNYIKDIQMFINEAYSDNEPLQDNQIRSKKVFNDYCNKIKQDLERLGELENDRLLDRTEKEELERVNAVLKHNLEEKVEIICELENKIQDLELLEALKQRWQQEEWCQGIELSAESLNSLFKYNKELFDRNLELDKKLESEFEDSADEICKIANERDKLLDENIDLKFDLSALNEAKKIEINYDEKLLKQIETLKKENQELRDRLYKVQYLEEENSKIFGKNQKLEQAISILKDYLMISVMQREDEYTLEANDYGISTLIKEEYDLLNEVFGDEIHK